jgi:hypothetical protein
MRRWIATKIQNTPMRQIGNPVFSNPVKENILTVSVRPMLMGLQLCKRHVWAFPLFDKSITLVWHGSWC